MDVAALAGANDRLLIGQLDKLSGQAWSCHIVGVRLALGVQTRAIPYHRGHRLQEAVHCQGASVAQAANRMR